VAFREPRGSEIDIHDRLVQECDPIRHSAALERFDIASSSHLPPFALLEDGTYVRGNQMKPSVKNTSAFTSAAFKEEEISHIFTLASLFGSLDDQPFI
jgi:hypothetical protein